MTGNTGADFGNTLYNDHHFHYGYHILAGAILGHLDPEWLEQNKEYVNMLVRDVANPSKKDKYFPLWRNFDWYHGHSWATGLYAAMDGKVRNRRLAWRTLLTRWPEPGVQLRGHDACLCSQDVG